jgi:hypothetical protein
MVGRMKISVHLERLQERSLSELILILSETFESAAKGDIFHILK